MRQDATDVLKRRQAGTIATSFPSTPAPSGGSPPFRPPVRPTVAAPPTTRPAPPSTRPALPETRPALSAAAPTRPPQPGPPQQEPPMMQRRRRMMKKAGDAVAALPRRA